MLRQILSVIGRRRIKRRRWKALVKHLIWNTLIIQERAFNTNDEMARKSAMEKVGEVRKLVGVEKWLETEHEFADYKERHTDEHTKKTS